MRSIRLTSPHAEGRTAAHTIAFTIPPTMKIVKPLWIVQPHDSPTASFRLRAALVRQHDAACDRTLEITFLERGAEAYAFTFG